MDFLHKNVMRRAESMRLQLLAAETLAAARQFMSPSELTKLFGLSPVDLSRYVSGIVVPAKGRAEEILEKFIELNVMEEILHRIIVVDEKGVVNIARIAFDVHLLTLAKAVAFMGFRDAGVDVVLTAAVNGVPLATLVADVLRVKLAVAKHELDASTTSAEYVEERYYVPSPPHYVSLYLPTLDVRRGKRVLIVDDLLRTGRTLNALVRMAEKVGAEVIGVFGIVSVGEGWKRAVHKLSIPYRICFELSGA